MARESAQSYNPATRRYGVGLIYNLSLKDAAGYVEIENEASAATQALEGSVLKASQARNRTKCRRSNHNPDIVKSS